MVKNYHVDNVTIEEILGWIKQGKIGLPEMQRPFVWSTAKVRDLIDSLYNGYPIGYIVTWQNPAVGLKNDSSSNNKEIIIDGQQRLTALKAALSGEKVVSQQYITKRIKISFKPSTGEFNTLNSAIEKDPLWINDISDIFKSDFNSYSYVTDNAKKLGMAPEDLGATLQKLLAIRQSEIGDIKLGYNLSIGAVTDIFNRINSKGVSLSSADLAMSRLSADTVHGGNNLRKQIEYFVQLLNDPNLLENIVKFDSDFANTKEFGQIKWIASEVNPIYKPRYADILHLILATSFKRGKLSDMVSLISGRDFEARNYSEEGMKANYEKMQAGATLVFNKSNFQRYLMILRDMGMRNSGKLGLVGHGVFNFGYILFLYLHRITNLSQEKIASYLKRWIIMSALTGRYSGSSETITESDLKMISRDANPINVLDEILDREMNDSFWNGTLPNMLRVQSTQASSWRIFQMSQIYGKDTAWLAKDTSTETVMLEEGNIHHIFPQAYLRKNGFSKGDINQIANYVWVTQPKNLEISDKAPKDYLSDENIIEFMSETNNRENAIPEEIVEYDFHNYSDFLNQRRRLMAKKMREFYENM
ncbi:GmrSD restriction endonuclease domain-containing protein [Limosilactobacillus reuteri]|uniref:GmrSD restriction endonuclease domain-containing protein n=1 Tax=Limosilactobacillus reuteri TaxID=1598 RepID=UPI003F6826E0